MHVSKVTESRVRRLGLQLLSLWLAAAGCLGVAMAPSQAQAAPALMLANVYRPGLALQDYWVSEKYDGVRGYWDGQALWTRGGERVAAPPWFTSGWPAVAMDGELWAGRGQFSRAVSTVRQQAADDAAWRKMQFMVFDLPAHGGTFTQRLDELRHVVVAINSPWAQAVVQDKVANDAALRSRLRQIVRLGGEGLMLHRGESLYKAQRSDDLLKVKTHEDAEARVISHLPGKGKYAGQLGALLVEAPAKGERPAMRFKLGTGLSDAQRRNPPPIGALVTYRFRGLNDSGVPRFASFMRIRED